VPDFLNIPRDLQAEHDAIASALERVAARFDLHLRSDLPPVSKLVRHIESYRGKMLRPVLALASALAAHPRVNDLPPADLLSDPHITIAAVCEMVHMATLVHDDVLDESDTRRRGLTVNRLHGNEAAVILGDYLIAAAFHLCSTLDDQSTSLEIARVSMSLCAGELLQLSHREDFAVDEPTYFEIVSRKTGDLIAAAAELGAKHSGAPPHTRRALADFGRKLGIAFQIQDDLLDLTADPSALGKPVHQDAGKGKLTLPLIHHLRTTDPTQRGRTLLLLRDASEQPSADSAASLTRALTQSGSIDHARTVARRLVAESRALLETLPHSRPRKVLEIAAEAVINRTR
jgi:octaprenyl-diphosphate synthase